MIEQPLERYLDAGDVPFDEDAPGELAAFTCVLGLRQDLAQALERFDEAVRVVGSHHAATP